MLNFLRKIRRKEFKGRYFKYAFGEILLVVIGILIALSINNWNEGRKDKMQAQATLGNLRAELETNLSSLDYEIKRADSAINAATIALNLLNKPDLPLSDRKLDSLISTSLYTPGWKPSDFILQELRTTGNLNKLEGDFLKKSLYLWVQKYNVVLEVNNTILEINDQIIEYIQKNGSLKNIDRFTAVMADETSNFNFSNRSLFYKLGFENQLDNKLYILRRIKIHFLEIKKQTEALIDYIKPTS